MKSEFQFDTPFHIKSLLSIYLKVYCCLFKNYFLLLFNLNIRQASFLNKQSSFYRAEFMKTTEKHKFVDVPDLVTRSSTFFRQC